jgi:hypothetical protein
MSVRVLSWMSVMVGDPLYRPYGSWLQLAVAQNGTDWTSYHDFAVKNVARPAAEFRTLGWQVASAARNCPMMEDLALFEAANGNLSAATAHFPNARRCYRNRDDVLRVTMEEADAWAKQKNPKRALEIIRGALQNAPDAPAAALLRKMEEDLAAATPTPQH